MLTGFSIYVVLFLLTISQWWCPRFNISEPNMAQYKSSPVGYRHTINHENSSQARTSFSYPSPSSSSPLLPLHHHHQPNLRYKTTWKQCWANSQSTKPWTWEASPRLSTIFACRWPTLRGVGYWGGEGGVGRVLGDEYTSIVYYITNSLNRSQSKSKYKSLSLYSL